MLLILFYVDSKANTTKLLIRDSLVGTIPIKCLFYNRNGFIYSEFNNGISSGIDYIPNRKDFIKNYLIEIVNIAK